jgi:hypothetical protein
VRVLVTAIADGTYPRVQLDSEVGSFWADWRGTPAPELGETFVEVDSGESLVWGVDIVSDHGADHRIETVDGDTWVSGIVEQLPLDGPVVLAVGPTTMCLDADGDPPLGTVDTTVTVRLRDVFVVPMNL